MVLANGSFLRGELDEIAAALGDTDAERDAAGGLRELAQVQTEISAAGWRIGKIVADLKLFSRPAETPSGTADVGRAIGWAIRATEHTFKHRARVTGDVAALLPAAADEAQIGQVFVNLLMNAVQAMAPGTDGNEVVIRGRADGERIVVEARARTRPSCARSPTPGSRSPFGVPRSSRWSPGCSGAGSPAGVPRAASGES